MCTHLGSGEQERRPDKWVCIDKQPGKVKAAVGESLAVRSWRRRSIHLVGKVDRTIAGFSMLLASTCRKEREGRKEGGWEKGRDREKH